MQLSARADKDEQPLVAWLSFQWCPFAAGSYRITYKFVQ